MERKEEDLGDETQQEETLASPGVIDKYQSAGKIANCKIEIHYKSFSFIIISRSSRSYQEFSSKC